MSNENFKRPVLLLGAGGHALVLLDILQQLEFEIAGIIAPLNKNEHPAFSQYKRLEQDSDVITFSVKDVWLVNGLGSLPSKNKVRRNKLFNEMKQKGFVFLTLISPHATVSQYADLAEGVQVFAGSIIQAATKVGMNTIINTKVCVDHGCDIGIHNHLAPGVTLSGGVITEKGVHIGTGAAIAQGVRISEGSVIGCGAHLVRDIAQNSKVIPSKSKTYLL